MTGLRTTLRSMPEFGSPAAVAVQVLAAPVFTALFYLLMADWGVGGSAAVAALAALTGSCAVQAVTLVASALAEDRFEGTLPYLISMGGHAVRLWAGRMAAMLAVAVAGGCASLAATLLTGRLTQGGAGPVLGAVVLLVVSSLASLGVGLCVAAVSLVCTDALFLANLVGFVLPLVCGLVAPVSVFPQPLRCLAYAVPVSWMTDAARAVADGRVRDAAAAAGCGIAVGIGWLVLAVAVTAVCEHRSRRDANIDALGI